LKQIPLHAAFIKPLNDSPFAVFAFFAAFALKEAQRSGELTVF